MTAPDKTPSGNKGEAGGAAGGLVLASASPARRALLAAAGLEFDVLATDIDEGRIREDLLAKGCDPQEIALALARAKAEEAGPRFDENTMVIGADQILLFAGEIFEKPGDLDAARDTLKRLRGQTHELISAASGYRAGRKVWSCCETARLTMRDFSDDFMESYLRRDEGQRDSVGAYRLEGAGVQLFSHIEGDFFTILGLPLLPLLEFLRREGLATP